jgi:hypothetical protein
MNVVGGGGGSELWSISIQGSSDYRGDGYGLMGELATEREKEDTSDPGLQERGVWVSSFLR